MPPARSIALAALVVWAACLLPTAAVQGKGAFLGFEHPSSWSGEHAPATGASFELHKTGEALWHRGEQWLQRCGALVYRPSSLLAVGRMDRSGAQELQEPEQPQREFTPLERIVAIVVELLCQASFVILAAYLYIKHKPEQLIVMRTPDDKESLDGIRWSDSMRLIGKLEFFPALVTWLIVNAVCIVVSIGGPENMLVSTLVLSVMLTYYRQGLREAFDMEHTPKTLVTDCLSYTCCGPCALVQDAMQVEEAKVLGHQAVSGAYPLHFGSAA